ncbi:MAG: hypothetical protein U0401_09010 [Anaerolineae bacterium]
MLKHTCKLLWIGVMLLLMLPVSSGLTFAQNPPPSPPPADFVTVVDNPYLPLIPGTKLIYEGMTEDGSEYNEVKVLPETRQVMGIMATVVQDTVYSDGELVENTFDWFAQDKAGNVWYLGEAVDNYEDGQLLDHRARGKQGWMALCLVSLCMLTRRLMGEKPIIKNITPVRPKTRPNC